LLIVVVSYVFYGWWDWRFLILIFISTLLDYSIGLFMSRSAHTQKKKVWLYVSIIFNLGILGFFKYYNFFQENFVQLLNNIGFQANSTTLKILLPVGISFYTFQTLSYTIDVYKDRLKPTTDFVEFAAFV